MRFDHKPLHSFFFKGKCYMQGGIKISDYILRMFSAGPDDPDIESGRCGTAIDGNFKVLMLYFYLIELTEKALHPFLQKKVCHSVFVAVCV